MSVKQEKQQAFCMPFFQSLILIAIAQVDLALGVFSAANFCRLEPQGGSSAAAKI